MNISWICHFWVFCFSLRCTDQRSGLLMFIINSDYYYYYAYELAGKFQIHGYISPCRHCYLLLFCFDRFPIFVLKTDEEHSPFNSMFNSIPSYELYFLQLLTTPCQNPSHVPLLSNCRQFSCHMISNPIATPDHESNQYNPHPLRLFAIIVSVTALNTKFIFWVSVAHVRWTYISLSSFKFFPSNCLLI